MKLRTLATALVCIPLLSYTIPPTPEYENNNNEISRGKENITKIKYLVEEILASCNCDTAKLHALNNFELGIATTIALLYQEPPKNKETHEQTSSSDNDKHTNVCIEKIVAQARKIRNE